jgi:hypothetical protein
MESMDDENRDMETKVKDKSYVKICLDKARVKTKETRQDSRCE